GARRRRRRFAAAISRGAGFARTRGAFVQGDRPRRRHSDRNGDVPLGAGTRAAAALAFAACRCGKHVGERTMNCNEAAATIAAYADGEVDRLRSHTIRKHLRTCPSCAAKHQELLALHARIRAEIPYFKAPSALRERVLATFPDTTPAPRVRDLAREGFALVGGRIDYLDRRPVAALVYRYRDHMIDVFVRPPTTHAPPAALRTVRGFNVAHATGSGMDWLAVSDLNAAEL